MRKQKSRPKAAWQWGPLEPPSWPLAESWTPFLSLGPWYPVVFRVGWGTVSSSMCCVLFSVISPLLFYPFTKLPPGWSKNHCGPNTWLLNSSLFSPLFNWLSCKVSQPHLPLRSCLWGSKRHLLTVVLSISPQQSSWQEVGIEFPVPDDLEGECSDCC